MITQSHGCFSFVLCSSIKFVFPQSSVLPSARDTDRDREGEGERDQRRKREMEAEKWLDCVLVPSGLAVMGLYHAWLLLNIISNPRRTVIGINAESRHQWVHSMMADPMKNGVLAVQTIRNNIMASTLLATTAITLSSLISVFVSSTSDSSSTAAEIIYGDKSSFIYSIKYFSILLCFLVAFLCNVQSIRYYAHVSFLVTVPTFKGNKDSIEYVARNLNRGSLFWSLGLRAFYVSFPLFLWIFGPIPMFVCCCVMCFILYFLDTTSSFTRELHTHSFREEGDANDLESAAQATETYWSEDSQLHHPLLSQNGHH